MFSLFLSAFPISLRSVRNTHSGVWSGGGYILIDIFLSKILNIRNNSSQLLDLAISKEQSRGLIS